MNTIAFRHSLRGRMLLYLVLPMVVTSVALIAFRAVNSLALVREQAQRQLRSLAEQVAIEVEQGTTQAVGVAKMMALAQEEPLFGRRAQSIAFARRVLEDYPEFTGAYFGYEPNADYRDAEFAGTSEAASLGPAFDPQGRFIPYWFRDENDNELIKLEPMVDTETSLYYDGCHRQYRDAGYALPMISQVRDVHDEHPGIWDTGEFMLGKREGEKTAYLFQWHHPLETGKEQILRKII